jgi:hypothetical protein
MFSFQPITRWNADDQLYKYCDELTDFNLPIQGKSAVLSFPGWYFVHNFPSAISKNAWFHLYVNCLDIKPFLHCNTPMGLPHNLAHMLVGSLNYSANLKPISEAKTCPKSPGLSL